MIWYLGYLYFLILKNLNQQICCCLQKHFKEKNQSVNYRIRWHSSFIIYCTALQQCWKKRRRFLLIMRYINIYIKNPTISLTYQQHHHHICSCLPVSIVCSCFQVTEPCRYQWGGWLCTHWVSHAVAKSGVLFAAQCCVSGPTTYGQCSARLESGRRTIEQRPGAKWRHGGTHELWLDGRGRQWTR